MTKLNLHNLGSRRWLAIAPPFVWLSLFLLVPFLLVLKISFADLKFGIPPYTPLAELKDQTEPARLYFAVYRQPVQCHLP
jgi:putrescine transport system permease protein